MISPEAGYPDCVISTTVLSMLLLSVWNKYFLLPRSHGRGQCTSPSHTKLAAMWSVNNFLCAPPNEIIFLHPCSAQRAEGYMICAFQNSTIDLIGGASAASEATLNSCPLRFAVYVGIIIIIVRAINP